LEEETKSNLDTFGMYKEIGRAEDFGLWDLAPCELVGDYGSFEGIHSFSFFNRSFILKKGKKLFRNFEILAFPNENYYYQYYNRKQGRTIHTKNETWRFFLIYLTLKA